MEKFVRLQMMSYNILPSITNRLVRCISYALKLYNHVIVMVSLYIKTEHEMPIYDQRTEWTAPQNDEKGQKSNKSDTHVSKYRKARDYRTYSYTKCVRLPDL